MHYNPMMRTASTQGCGLSTACSSNIRIAPLWKKKKMKKVNKIKRFDDQNFQKPLCNIIFTRFVVYNVNISGDLPDPVLLLWFPATM